jgi:hypothetical protein
MALLFCDGFDGYSSTAELASKGWYSGNDTATLSADTKVNWNATGGAYGGGGIALGPTNNYEAILFPAFTFSQGVTVNSAVMFRQVAPPPANPSGSTNYGGLMAMASGTGTYSYSSSVFTCNTAGCIQFVGFGVLSNIGSPGTHNVCDGQWHWIEMQVILTTGTTGSATVYVDGELDLQVSGVRTIYSAYSLPNGTIGLGLVTNNSAASVTSYYDDFIVWNNSGSSFNTFPIGQKRIYTGKPTGPGVSTQFTPSAGNNYAIAGQGYSGSATLTSNGSGKLDLYTTSILNGANPVDIDAVVLNTYARNVGGGVGFFTPALRNNGVLQTGPRTQLTANSVNYRSAFLLDANGNPWTKATIDALQFGGESSDGN